MLSLLYALWAIFDLMLAFPFVCLAVCARCFKRNFDVGIGPEPMVSHAYHQQALQQRGYRVETFVSHTYFITDAFDVRADRIFPRFLRPLAFYLLFVRAMFRYRCLYFYFSGGPLGFTPCLWRLEPWLYKLAGIKTVVMPYGSDVQEMSRSKNLVFKHVMSKDYPRHRTRRRRIAAQIDLWTAHADHVIGGCEWVDYMHHWDTLMLAHFSIDTERWKPTAGSTSPGNVLRILHAPNHRNIKGTNFFVDAIEQLQAEGEPVELVLLERVGNERVLEAMESVDVVADQLVVGWYGMFALEAMAMEKPVLCYLRSDLEELYQTAGLLEQGETPIVRCSPETVKDTIRELVVNRHELPRIGKLSREFVLRHHSLESVGTVFDMINREIGLSNLDQIQPIETVPASVHHRAA